MIGGQEQSRWARWVSLRLAALQDAWVAKWPPRGKRMKGDTELVIFQAMLVEISR